MSGVLCAVSRDESLTPLNGGVDGTETSEADSSSHIVSTSPLTTTHRRRRVTSCACQYWFVWRWNDLEDWGRAASLSV